MAASLVDELIKRPELLALGGEERVISVLFSDVADFSTISEKLTPTQLVELLNEYLTAMTDIVMAQGGIIDKYQGDAIMAEFGVPVPIEDHALRSCYAALDMMDELARLREKWAAERRPQLHARVGINTGLVLLGNLGSHRIMDYTVMGDHVNLASRLEGANKPYGTRIMVSEFTWQVVQKDLIGRELDRIAVKGKEQPVCVYEVIARRSEGVTPDTATLLEDFANALALYQAARFTDALSAFLKIAARHPADGPTALYVERCREFLHDPPPHAWDGVYRMKTK
jgi:adenylate cyclase